MVLLEEFMEIVHLSQAGYTISAISRLTGRDRKTVRKYLSQGARKPPQMAPRPNRPSKLKGFEKDILNYLNMAEARELPPSTAIYEKLVSKGYSGSLSLLQKRVKRYQEKVLTKVAVRFETLPGEQAQVDWGEKKIRDNQSGHYQRVYVFCMTLAYSRMRFVHFTPRADMYHFLACHQEAFRYFGGIPEEILYDQNRCVITKPGFSDPVYNQQFLDFARHYGFMSRVCRPYRPQSKGKVENAIKYVKRNFLSLPDTANPFVLNLRQSVHHTCFYAINLQEFLRQSMKEKIIIIGDGSHARMIQDFLDEENSYQIIGVTSKNEAREDFFGIQSWGQMKS